MTGGELKQLVAAFDKAQSWMPRLEKELQKRNSAVPIDPRMCLQQYRFAKDLMNAIRFFAVQFLQKEGFASRAMNYFEGVEALTTDLTPEEVWSQPIFDEKDDEDYRKWNLRSLDDDPLGIMLYILHCLDRFLQRNQVTLASTECREFLSEIREENKALDRDYNLYNLDWETDGLLIMDLHDDYQEKKSQKRERYVSLLLQEAMSQVYDMWQWARGMNLLTFEAEALYVFGLNWAFPRPVSALQFPRSVDQYFELIRPSKGSALVAIICSGMD